MVCYRVDECARPLSSPSGIRFAPRSVHTSFQATVHGASHIFCSPKKRDAKRCSLASCNRSICTSLYVKGSPPRAYLRCQPRLPGSVRATSCGAHLDWPSLANRPFQSQLTAERVKGNGLSARWATPNLRNAGVAGEPCKFPLHHVYGLLPYCKLSYTSMTGTSLLPYIRPV